MVGLPKSPLCEKRECALEFVVAAAVTRGFLYVEALLSRSRHQGGHVGWSWLAMCWSSAQEKLLARSLPTAYLGHPVAEVIILSNGANLALATNRIAILMLERTGPREERWQR